MVTLVLNFLREQGILIMLGWMLAGGIFRQVTATRRYRRLRAGIQSLTVQLSGSQGMSSAASPVGSQAMSSTADSAACQGMADKKETARRRRARREQAEYGQMEATRLEPLQKIETLQRDEAPIKNAGEPIHTPSKDPELDAQLLYLKQSLDRIAAGRDQKLEEETREREHRKLTPEQEAIIADILREYLS